MASKGKFTIVVGVAMLTGLVVGAFLGHNVKKQEVYITIDTTEPQNFTLSAEFRDADRV